MASGLSSTSVGFEAQANGINAAAIGAGAVAAHNNATAIGAGAATARDNQLMLGTAIATYTAPGLASAASSAAQSGPTQFVTTDAAGNLAAVDFGTLGLVTADQLNDAYEGSAIAMAMTRVPTTLADGETIAVASGWGTFNGENAVSIGATARVTDHVYVNGGGAVGTGRSNGGGAAGVVVGW